MFSVTTVLGTQSRNDGLNRRLRSTQLAINKLDAYSQTLDDRINQLHSQYKSLFLQQQQLETFKISHQHLIAPVRRLLPEILQRIFALCLPETHDAAMCSREAPLLLGQICSEWRQITYSTSELWSSIHIVVPPVPRDPDIDQYALGPPIHIISEWLSRSRIHPLSISMKSSLDFQTETMHIKTKKYVETIIPFSRRWRSLKLNLGEYDWSELFSQLSMDDVPLLEELHVAGRFRNLDDDDMNSDFSKIKRKQSILCASHLHRISLPAFSGEIIHFPINWQHLTALNLHDGVELTLTQTTEMLSRCPNLETCSIPCQKPQEGLPFVPTSATSKPIFLPKLFSLKIVCHVNINPDSYLINLLQIMHTPILRHLSVVEASGYFSSMSNAEDLLTPALFSFKARLVQPLEELRMEVFSWSTVEVVTVLKTFSEVKRLSLEIRPYNNSKSYSFLYRWGGTDSLPRRQFFWDDKQLEMFMVNQNHDCLRNGKEKDHPTDSLLPASINMDLEMEHGGLEYLCPHLEVFHCTGAIFSADPLFKFLRFRRSSKVGTRLQKASISILFTPDFIPSTSMALFRKGIEKIEEETGLIVDIKFPSDSLQQDILCNPIRPVYSSYHGLHNGMSRWRRTSWGGGTKAPIYFGF